MNQSLSDCTLLKMCGKKAVSTKTGGEWEKLGSENIHGSQIRLNRHNLVEQEGERKQRYTRMLRYKVYKYLIQYKGISKKNRCGK